MSDSQTNLEPNPDTQSVLDITYTKEELLQTTKWYESSMPRQKKNIIKAKAIHIDDKDVILSTGLKADGPVSLAEFKDLPDLKVGDEVEVYLETIENKHGDIMLSRKKLQTFKTWQIIEEALASQKPLEAIVKKTSRGGLIVDIQNLEAFLPGSQIDTTAITDYDAFLDKKIQVAIIKANKAKNNVIVSRKTVIKNELEEQKKAIIEKLEEGQILEGTVKNIEKYGAFVDLGGIVGLVYVKDMVWEKRIDHPDKARDDQGNPIFEKGKKVKVVVLGFDKEKNYLSLGTKPLFHNPWDDLIKEVKENSIVKCKVVKLMDYGAILETSYGTEAFMHSSDMSHSNYMQQPSEILKIDQELEGMVIHIDNEKQDLRLGLKQLTPDPWQTKDFFIKYGLNTHHKAKVAKFTEYGAYLELVPGVEGFLHNRHLSWTKKVNNPEKILEKNKPYEVLIIGIDESKKILELGFRELEESPWDNFQKIFIPGSTHKATVLQKLPQGIIVQLAEGPESFVFNKELTKKETKDIEIGKELDLVVVDFMRYEEKIRLSHDVLFDKSNKPLKSKDYSTPINLIKDKKITLEDVALVKTAKKQKKEDKAEKTKEPTK